MSENSVDPRETWKTILLFLFLLLGCLSVGYFGLLKLHPTRMYIGVIMWSPGLAALITMRMSGRPIASLPWKWGEWRFNRQGYIVPVLYASLAYGLIWWLGLAGVGNEETFQEWAGEIGLEDASRATLIVVMIILLATIGFIRGLSTIVGEEIGWRGFLIWELRKVMPFGMVSLISGLIWSAFHWPLIFYFGDGDPLIQTTFFTIMIVSMSVMMTYFTFRSGSMWPAILFHGAHNIFILDFFIDVTIETETSIFWAGEYGLMIAITTTLFAAFFLRKAKAEGL